VIFGKQHRDSNNDAKLIYGYGFGGKAPQSFAYSPHLTMRQNGRESGLDCANVLVVLQSKSVNNVCKLLQLQVPQIPYWGFGPELPFLNPRLPLIFMKKAE